MGILNNGRGKRDDIADSLRARAEARIRDKNIGEPYDYSAGLMLETLHELRVSQVELEMQNDDLRQAQDDLLAAKAKYFGFYNMAPVGYFTVDSLGFVVEANQTSAEMVSAPMGEILNRSFTSFVNFDSQDAYYLFSKKALETGKSQSCEITMANGKSGGFCARLEGTATLDSITGKPLLHLVMIDVTARKREEEELRLAKSEAEAAVLLKDRFVTMAAHDLRSPLASMLSLLRLFAKRRPASDTNEEKILNAIFGSGEGLIAMIDNLLQTARFHAGKIVLRQRFFRVHRAAEAVIGLMTQSAGNKGIEIVNDIPRDFVVYADPSLLSEVLLNLLSNAVKFCRNGDKIFFFTPTGSKSAVAVRDTGKGICDNILPNIFNHGVNASTPGTSGEKGKGLGLPHSHDIIKVHGGELTYESRPGEGSIFTIHLPYRRPMALVVDPNPNSLEWLGANLSMMEIDVILSAGTEHALGEIKSHRPNVIIMNIDSPKGDSAALAENLRLGADTKDIPIIAASFVERGGDDLSIPPCMDDIIILPVEGRSLAAKIWSFLA